MKKKLKAFSYITIDHIVINCKCYKKVVLLSVSAIPLKWKQKTTALTSKYKYLIHNRFQIISPVLNTFRFLKVYTGKSWCQPSHWKQPSSDRLLFSRNITGKYYFYYLLFFFCWNGMVKKSEAFDNLTLKVYLLTCNIS